MTKEEFIAALADKLREGMSEAEVVRELQYYQGYIDGLIRNGRTEEEAVEELGEPLLIARTLLESPRDQREELYESGSSGEELYREGAFQAEHEPAPLKEKEAFRSPLFEEDREESEPETAERVRGELEHRGTDFWHDADGSFAFRKVFIILGILIVVQAVLRLALHVVFSIAPLLLIFFVVLWIYRSYSADKRDED